MLVDERTGLVHDYTKKGGVISAEIIAPDGGSAERSALWNAAESAEKRKDSRTAREWIVAIPAELDAGQRRELAVSFGAQLASRYGVAVDVAIHEPDREGDNRNHHAHVLTTTRRVSRGAAGELVMGDKASIELSDKKRRELGLGPAADEVKAIRQLWEQTANRALERAGSGERIDARSLKDQGLDREATTHLGPVASEMERRGRISDRGDGNRQVAVNNEQRQELSAQIIDLKTERERRAKISPEAQQSDPLDIFRDGLDKAHAAGDGIDMQIAKRRFELAEEAQANGQNPKHIYSQINTQAQADVISGLYKANEVHRATARKAMGAEGKGHSEGVAERDQQAMPAADLVKAWDGRKVELVRDYRQRAQRLESRINQQIRGISTKRWNADVKHSAKRPAEPTGLFAAFKRSSYETALDAWKATATRIKAWKVAREKDLHKRLERVRGYLTPSGGLAERDAERKLQKERPELAARLPQARDEIKREKEAKKQELLAQKRERQALQKGRPGRGGQGL